jgi:hypothetical protein
MIEQTEIPFGRGAEIEAIQAHIKGRKHLHIHGERGAGKSFLLQWACNNWRRIDNTLSPIYCSDSRTLREILFQICSFLLRRFNRLRCVDKFGRIRDYRSCDELTGADMTELRQMVFRNIQREPVCLICDHLEHVTPKMHSLITDFMNRALVITASRQSWEVADYAFSGSLSYHSLYIAKKLCLPNLNRHDAFRLMGRLAERMPLKEEDKDQLLNEVFHVTSGNPGKIKQIFNKAGMPEYRVDGQISLKLILIDLKMEEVMLGQQV